MYSTHTHTHTLWTIAEKDGQYSRHSRKNEFLFFFRSTNPISTQLISYSTVASGKNTGFCLFLLLFCKRCPRKWPCTIFPSRPRGSAGGCQGQRQVPVLLSSLHIRHRGRREQTINPGAELKVRGRVWKNRVTIIKWPYLTLISLTLPRLSGAPSLWLMPSFAYSGHRHRQHALLYGAGRPCDSLCWVFDSCGNIGEEGVGKKRKPRSQRMRERDQKEGGRD